MNFDNGEPYTRKRARTINVEDIKSRSHWDRTFYSKKNTLMQKAADLEFSCGCLVAIVVWAPTGQFYYAGNEKVKKAMMRSKLLDENAHAHTRRPGWKPNLDSAESLLLSSTHSGSSTTATSSSASTSNQQQTTGQRQQQVTSVNDNDDEESEEEDLSAAAKVARLAAAKLVRPSRRSFPTSASSATRRGDSDDHLNITIVSDPKTPPAPTTTHVVSSDDESSTSSSSSDSSDDESDDSDDDSDDSDDSAAAEAAHMAKKLRLQYKIYKKKFQMYSKNKAKSSLAAGKKKDSSSVTQNFVPLPQTSSLKRVPVQNSSPLSADSSTLPTERNTNKVVSQSTSTNASSASNQPDSITKTSVNSKKTHSNSNVSGAKKASKAPPTRPQGAAASKTPQTKPKLSTSSKETSAPKSKGSATSKKVPTAKPKSSATSKESSGPKPKDSATSKDSSGSKPKGLTTSGENSVPKPKVLASSKEGPLSKTKTQSGSTSKTGPQPSKKNAPVVSASSSYAASTSAVEAEIPVGEAPNMEVKTEQCDDVPTRTTVVNGKVVQKVDLRQLNGQLQSHVAIAEKLKQQRMERLREEQRLKVQQRLKQQQQRQENRERQLARNREKQRQAKEQEERPQQQVSKCLHNIIVKQEPGIDEQQPPNQQQQQQTPAKQQQQEPEIKEEPVTPPQDIYINCPTPPRPNTPSPLPPPPPIAPTTAVKRKLEPDTSDEQQSKKQKGDEVPPQETVTHQFAEAIHRAAVRSLDMGFETMSGDMKRLIFKLRQAIYPERHPLKIYLRALAAANKANFANLSLTTTMNKSPQLVELLQRVGQPADPIKWEMFNGMVSAVPVKEMDIPEWYVREKMTDLPVPSPTSPRPLPKTPVGSVPPPSSSHHPAPQAAAPVDRVKVARKERDDLARSCFYTFDAIIRNLTEDKKLCSFLYNCFRREEFDVSLKQLINTVPCFKVLKSSLENKKLFAKNGGIEFLVKSIAQRNPKEYSCFRSSRKGGVRYTFTLRDDKLYEEIMKRELEPAMNKKSNHHTPVRPLPKRPRGSMSRPPPRHQHNVLR